MVGVGIVAGLLAVAALCFWLAHRRALGRARMESRREAYAERAEAERRERERLETDLGAIDDAAEPAEAAARAHTAERLAREPMAAEVDATLSRIEARRSGS